MNEETSNYDSYTQNILQQQANISTLQVRLDTQPFLDKMESFLRCQEYKYEFNEKTKKQELKLIQYAKPLANEEGIRWIMQRLSAIINSHAVQGNYRDDRYDLHIWMIRTSLAYNIMTNIYKWEIEEEDYHNIIDMFMDVSKPFLSRTLNNKERESYGISMQTREINTIQPQQSAGLGGLFK